MSEKVFDNSWDASVRTGSLGVFCRDHGFYDCPVCKGETPVWEIPVVDGGNEVGRLKIPWDYEDTLILVTRGTRTVHVVDPEGEGAVQSAHFPQAEMIPLRVNPGLYAKIKLLLEEEQ